jgi:hypothetical protein
MSDTVFGDRHTRKGKLIQTQQKQPTRETSAYNNLLFEVLSTHVFLGLGRDAV